MPFCFAVVVFVVFKPPISEFAQQNSRKKRMACVTNVTELLLGCFVVIFTQHYFFLVFYKYTCLKEGEVWRKVYSNKIIVTHVREGLSSSFLSRPVAYVHYYPGMILSYLIALTFSILA